MVTQYLSINNDYISNRIWLTRKELVLRGDNYNTNRWSLSSNQEGVSHHDPMNM